MKKILFIIASYSMGGGAEQLLTSIVNNLSTDKYEISIIEILGSDVKKEPVNANINVLPCMMKADDPLRKKKMYSFYHEWDKVIEKYIPQDFDLYVSFNYQRPSFLLPSEKKCIAWIHSDVYNLAQESLKEERELQDKAFDKALKIVSISDITTQSLIDLFPRHLSKMVEIYNGIDIEKVKRLAKEKSEIKVRHPAIISMGRLEKRKNPLRMLEIFKKVHDEKPEVHLYHMGFGPEEEVLKEKIKEYDLEDCIHLLGYIQNPYPILNQCDVNCMFSESEGFPLSLMEGTILNKPFVSSVIGGSRILANGQTCGKTVKTDGEAVSEIINYLNADKEEMAKACQKSIIRFELKSYIRKIEELFDEVLEL